MSEDNARLSRIETLWSVVQRAHTSNMDVASSAQQALLERYGGAIRSYLNAALKNPDVANDLFQEFAFKFLKGDFKNADPAKGKFRSFVKTVLFRMVALHYRKLSSNKMKQVESLPEDTGWVDENLSEEEFLQAWRNGVLERTWEALQDAQLAGGAKHYTILRSRVENPDMEFSDLAASLSATLGKPITPGNARVMVHRARTKFANLMIGRVADSLENPGRESIEEELIDLQLIDFCREELSQYNDSSEKS